MRTPGAFVVAEGVGWSGGARRGIPGLRSSHQSVPAPPMGGVLVDGAHWHVHAWERESSGSAPAAQADACKKQKACTEVSYTKMAVPVRVHRKARRRGQPAQTPTPKEGPHSLPPSRSKTAGRFVFGPYQRRRMAMEDAKMAEVSPTYKKGGDNYFGGSSAMLLHRTVSAAISCHSQAVEGIAARRSTNLG